MQAFQTLACEEGEQRSGAESRHAPFADQAVAGANKCL